nr:acyl-CoA thioesterase [Saprospiraceae bacterium]
MIVHETKKRVRYGETDRMGILYYGNYSLYYEIGRVEMLRHLGLSYKEVEDHSKILMPVVSVNMRYVRPAYYDEEVRIRTTLEKWPGSSITFGTEILRMNGELINKGEVKLVFVHASDFSRAEMPDVIREKIKPYFEEVDQ